MTYDPGDQIFIVVKRLGRLVFDPEKGVGDVHFPGQFFQYAVEKFIKIDFFRISPTIGIHVQPLKKQTPSGGCVTHAPCSACDLAVKQVVFLR